jgi:aminoglycoside phosphotransferase (APT) family kinase protein
MHAEPLESLALEAWGRLRPGSAVPAQIDILKGRREPARRGAYRLAGAGPKGAPVIAKRCPTAKACVEHTIYAEVLPHLPLPTPHYYGLVEEKDGTCCWLFLEDVGAERYSSGNEEHRRLAGRWLGALHTSAARLAVAARLPDRGPGHYLERLRSARSRILGNLANPALEAADLAVLRMIVSQCEALEARWHQVERFCAGLPRTVVHGDFAEKNVRVRTRPSATALLPFDWSNAGWGVPAIDLAQSPLPSARFAANPDLAAYWAVVRDHWPACDLRAVRQWGQLATLFRLLAAVAWSAASLGQEWVEKTMTALRFYQTALDREVQTAGWLA